MWKNTDWHHSELIPDYHPKMLWFRIRFPNNVIPKASYISQDRIESHSDVTRYRWDPAVSDLAEVILSITDDQLLWGATHVTWPWSAGPSGGGVVSRGCQWDKPLAEWALCTTLESLVGQAASPSELWVHWENASLRTLSQANHHGN